MKQKLSPTDAKQRLQRLKAQVDDFRYRYHVLNDPGVTDDVYESLIREVKEIEAQYPEFKISHTFDRVAGAPLDAFTKVTHNNRMLSLNDVFSIEELEEWDNRVRKLVGNTKYHYFAELKLDGLAINLRYENGKLVQAATRGDGFIGENITENAKMVDAIPLQLLPPFPRLIEIRGEVIMFKQSLEKINRDQEKAGKPKFANTRNAAAGSVRQLDPKIVKQRHLDFFAYDISEVDGMPMMKTHSEKHALLRALGAPVPAEDDLGTSIADVKKFIDHVGKIRESLPYHIDGVVISIDETDLQQELGVVGKAPRYAVAYKYPAEKVTTVVKDITVNVGRTGVLTPLAHFEPVLVAGSTVSKATLHNIDQIRRLDIRIGDTVVIQKAGDVIPEVVQVLPDLRSGKEKVFNMPKDCPVCGSTVEKKKGFAGEEQVAYFCTNDDCPAKNTRSIIHFVSVLNIYEVGPKVIERLQEEGLISDAADLFALTEADLSGLERFGAKSAQNVINAIKERTNPPLDQFIASLGIPQVGAETARDIALHFGSFEKFWNAKPEEFDAIENIGPIVTESLTVFRKKQSSKHIVAKLLRYVTPQVLAQKKGGIFSGMTVVLTGTMGSLGRTEAKNIIQKEGGKVAGSVSKNTSLVVAGDSPGSKYTDAERLGVKIVDEAGFLKMIKGMI